MLLMIDNYDSFTYNLVQYFQQLQQEVMVLRNDEVDIAKVASLAPTHLVISPGPCSPNEAGASLDLVRHFAGKLPILGVCLGHQTIAQVFGGRVVRAPRVMHGKTSLIEHHQTDLFEGLPNPLRVTRYHSLLVAPDSLPDELEVTAWYHDRTNNQRQIMALRHRTLAIYGVQFHPESVLTEQGHALLNNFLKQRVG
ncbi:aminodeoxychorismate/anthranilate synthase component II [Neiella marina]|uniref:Aminodeoxychorismate/anthranilate synthase component II n=1 Tax=Neiella holothuriorum TaxID=2870530 RepID=A0ABS7EE75_9GAMM|nr:aminodeoxychorismate/anthranilate synthase component II [Neiella holothuriorum]MBW8189997.1 aminodeoxychorismate/anthranilate synthase component II [Neiella holothuriorum]